MEDTQKGGMKERLKERKRETKREIEMERNRWGKGDRERKGE